MNAAFDQFLKTLERSERLLPRELARYHQQLLTRLVRHACDSLPFYRARLDQLVTSEGEVDLRRWNGVPILTRDDVLANGQEMRVADLPAEYGEIDETQTSGSTGVPLKIATNGMVFFAANALLTRAVRRFGIDTSRPLAFIGRFHNEAVEPYPEGSTQTGWSYADPAALCHKLEVMTPADQQVEWLSRTKAPYLATTPSGALAIAYAVTPEQGRALGIEAVILIGETIPDGARELIRDRLGARVAPIYACREIGHIASECERGSYHVAVENALVEIVDDDGEDVAFGCRGRVLLTGLYNYVMPFIRYEIGDIAVAGSEPCSCGRTLPVIKQIEGRTRNMFVFRDGTRFWPRYSSVRPMQAFVPFRRYQLVQVDHETIEFRYISDGSGRSADVEALNTYARSNIHPSVTFCVIEVDSFVPGPGGKIEEFVSKVPSAQLSRA